MVKQIVVHPYSGVALSSRREQVIQTQINLDESPAENYAE